MEILKTESLNSITGGGFKLWYIIGGGLVLFAGIIDGFLNPNKCNN